MEGAERALLEVYREIPWGVERDGEESVERGSAGKGKVEMMVSMVVRAKIKIVERAGREGVESDRGGRRVSGRSKGEAVCRIDLSRRYKHSFYSLNLSTPSPPCLPHPPRLPLTFLPPPCPLSPPITFHTPLFLPLLPPCLRKFLTITLIQPQIKRS